MTGDPVRDAGVDRRRAAVDLAFSDERTGALRGAGCLVVGGGGDLGGVAALGLAAAGGRVIVAGRDHVRSEAVVDAGSGLPGTLAALDVDLRDPASIDALYASALAVLGQLDVVVNAAGTNVRRAAADVSPTDWDVVIDTNLKGTFFSCQAAHRAMAPRGGGRIVNIASAAGLAARAWPTTSVYGTSKAGVIHLTRYLAVEWAVDRVAVNCLAPGYFETSMTAPLVAQPGAVDRLLSNVPMARFGELSEFVQPLLFLAQPGSAFVTGHTLSVDGGRTVT